eukprot:6855715-Alexandrium_andersonii.AAC.1
MLRDDVRRRARRLLNRLSGRGGAQTSRRSPLAVALGERVFRPREVLTALTGRLGAQSFSTRWPEELASSPHVSFATGRLRHPGLTGAPGSQCSTV